MEPDSDTAVLSVTEFKSRSAGDSVDNPQLEKVIWCEHVQAFGDYLKAHVPTVMIASSPPTYVIVEDLKVKLICGRCLRKALEIRAEHFSSH